MHFVSLTRRNNPLCDYSIMLFCRRKFLSEFLEVGGMLTVLEVLSAKKATEEDRLEALHLLIDVTKTGRQCKELLCESNGVRCVARCLAQSSSTTTQDTAQRLLFHLFQVSYLRTYVRVCMYVHTYVHNTYYQTSKEQMVDGQMSKLTCIVMCML